MPPLEEDGLLTPTVVWERIGIDRFGDYAVDGPRQIYTRWEDSTREALGPEGNKVTITGDLYLKETLPIGSMVWKGSLNDLPDNPTDIRQIFGYNDTDDLKARYVQRSASLTRYEGQLPAYVGTGS